MSGIRKPRVSVYLAGSISLLVALVSVLVLERRTGTYAMPATGALMVESAGWAAAYSSGWWRSIAIIVRDSTAVPPGKDRASTRRWQDSVALPQWATLPGCEADPKWDGFIMHASGFPFRHVVRTEAMQSAQPQAGSVITSSRSMGAFALNVLVGAFLTLPIITAAVHGTRMLTRGRTGGCRVCGYPRDGLNTSKCPECGTEMSTGRAGAALAAKRE